MKRIATIALAAGILALVTSCQTAPSYAVQGNPVQTYTENGMTVRAEFLPESELERKVRETV